MPASTAKNGVDYIMKSYNGGFKNFWHYNKGKIIALVLFIACMFVVITQCSPNPDSSFSILCVSETNNFGGELLMEKLEENVDFSKTDEGKQEMYYEYIEIPKSVAEQSQVGTFEQLNTRLINDDFSLLLLDKETVYMLHDRQGVFVDITDFADKYGIAGEDRYMTDEGFVCAINVESNEFLKSCSVNCEQLYVAIRVPKDGNVKKYTNAKAALEYILSNR